MIKNIIPQMFDVRPLDENGGLDFEKIRKIKNSEKVIPTIFPKRKIIKNIQHASSDVITKQSNPRCFKSLSQAESVFVRPKIEFFDEPKEKYTLKPVLKKEATLYKPDRIYKAKNISIIQNHHLIEK